MENAVDHYIRTKNLKHVFIAVSMLTGCSTETTPYQMTKVIQITSNQKEIAMSIFLDIYCAVDNKFVCQKCT